MGLPNSPFIFYIMLIGLSANGWALKYLSDTIKKERPEQWEKLGKPKYGFFSGKAPGPFREYILKGSYRNDPNPKISRAVLYLRISGALLIFGMMASVYYFYLTVLKK